MKRLSRVFLFLMAVGALVAQGQTHTPQYMPAGVITAPSNVSYLAEGDSITAGFNDTPAWSGATTYGAGQYVVSSNVLYFSIQSGNLNHTPAAAPDWWQNAGSGTNAWANPYPLAVQSLRYFSGKIAFSRNNAVTGARTYDVISRYTTGSPTPKATCQAAGTTYAASWFSLDIGTNDITAISSGAITNFAIASNVATITVPNTFAVNQYVMNTGLATGTYLNGAYLQVLSASGTQYTATFVHANVGSTADTGTAFTNAATIWYAIQQITHQAKADGCKVALLNLTPRTNTGSMTAALQVELTNLNTFIRGGLSGTDFDVFVDVFADMGGPNNLAIFPAGLHPSQIGQLRMASLLNKALITQGQPNALPPDNLSVPGTGANNYRATMDALTSNTAGAQDTAVGVKALAANTTGTGNTAVGYGALFSVSTASGDTAVGQSAGQSCTGADLTIMGTTAMANVLCSGSDDTAIGFQTAGSLTTGNQNTAVGSKAMSSVAAQSGDVALGYGALFTNTGSTNVGVGNLAGSNGTGSNNVLLGNSAAANASFTGGQDIVIGSGVGAALTSGNNDVFIGGSGATTGSNDTAVGQGSTVGAGNGFELALGSTASATAQNSVEVGTGTNATANTLQFYTWNAMDTSGNTRTNFDVQPVGTVIASAATIAPITPIVHVSGVVAIVNITLPTVAVGGGTFTGCVTLIPDGLWTTTAAGNIALASTAVVSKTLTECYDGTKWYPSY